MSRWPCCVLLKRTELTLHTMCLSRHAASHLAPFYPFPLSFHLSLSPLTPRRLLRPAFLRSPLGDYSPLAYASTERGSASLQVSCPLISFPSLAFILRFPLPSSPILLVRASWAAMCQCYPACLWQCWQQSLRPTNRNRKDSWDAARLSTRRERIRHIPFTCPMPLPFCLPLSLSNVLFTWKSHPFFLLQSDDFFIKKKVNSYLAIGCVSNWVLLKVWERGEKLKIHVHVWENNNFVKSLHGVWTCLTGAHSAAH